MNKIYLGMNTIGDRIELDIEEENINFILLAGKSASGKSVFHDNLYKELLEKYSKDEISFLFLDMTRVSFFDWPAEHLIKPIIYDPKDAIEALNELSDLKTHKKIIVHIEECDMVYKSREEVERALTKLKSLKNIYIIYSTSRLDREYLAEWMERFIDLKVVFQVALEEESLLLLGNKSANQIKSAGERVLAFNNKRIVCRPFTNAEIETSNSFFDSLRSKSK